MCQSLLTCWGFCVYTSCYSQETMRQGPLTGEGCLWHAGKFSHTNIILSCEWTKYILLNYSQLSNTFAAQEGVTVELLFWLLYLSGCWISVLFRTCRVKEVWLVLLIRISLFNYSSPGYQNFTAWSMHYGLANCMLV